MDIIIWIFVYSFLSYLKGAKEGDDVIIDATTVKAGKSLAYLECELKHKKDGSIIAKGSQTKFILQKWITPYFAH